MIEHTLRGNALVLRLAAPNRNALTLELLEALGAAIDNAKSNPQVSKVVLLGSPEHFSSGADLGLVRAVETAEQAIELSDRFQKAFQRIEESPKPVIAAMGGMVLGGALELALACHGRVAADNCRFRMPEVTLGIVPGAGGTQRLPRLVGAHAALEMLLSGRTIDAAKALAMGLVDRVCPPAELLEAALAWEPPRPLRRSTRLQPAPAPPDGVAPAEALLARTPPEVVAPRLIFEAVKTGLEESVEAGLACERRAFAQSLASAAAQNRIYLFFASRQTSKVPEVEGVSVAPVRSAAVVGVGTMGANIAQALAQAGLDVTAVDQDPAALDRARQRIASSLDRRVARGQLAPPAAEAIFQRIRLTHRWSDLGGCDLVVEAVYEDPAVKQAVFQRLEPLVGPQAVLASNTSAISLDLLAAGLTHPERLVAMHFFHPAHHMPLVEVAYRPQSAPQAIATALHVARILGKTPVLVRNCPGFLVDRLFIPYVKEAFALLEDGAPPEAVDRAMVTFGFPMGPFALIDMTGLDILIASDRQISAAYPWHGPMPPVAFRLVEEGRLGQKTHAGVYEYSEGDPTARPSPVTARIVAEVQGRHGHAHEPPADDEIVQRLVLRMVNEAYYALGDGIARSASDIDVATVLGIGFPDYRGGVLRYARQCGPDAVFRRLECLAQRHGTRFRPSPFLQQEARNAPGC